jgi:hypothetical protein
MPGPYAIDEILAAGDPLHVEHHTALAQALNESASAATPSVLVLRDANGRFQAATPSAAADVAIKSYVDLRALIASPTVTGTPAAPTAAIGTSTTQIATTAFVQTSTGTYNGVVQNSTTTSAPVLTDVGKLVLLNNAAAITVTLPIDSGVNFPIGSVVDFVVINTGMATFTVAAGGFLKVTPSAVTRANGSAVSAIKYAANAWLVTGDLA